MTRPSLTELHAFAAIATYGSFRKAAGILGTAPSTLSHMMKALEGKVGARLLHRTTRSVSLTEAGHDFLARIRPLLDAFDQAVNELGQARGHIRGVLRLNTVSSVAFELVDAVLPDFLVLHPEIEVDLASEGRLIDIVAAGFDAGIRLGSAVPQDMNALAFGPPVRFLPVAAPVYLNGRPHPETPYDLLAHECIRLRLPSGKRYRWEFVRHGESAVVDVAGRITLNAPDLVLKAAVRGLGIAYVIERDARPYIEAGDLIPLLKPWCPEESGLHVYYPGHRHIPPPLRAFLDFLKTETPPSAC